MIIVVTGGRAYHNTKHVFRVLDGLHQGVAITQLRHGDMSGADTAAGFWAEARNVPQRAYPAFWGLHGRAAGPMRNAEMIEDGRVGLVVAFPGGKGTADMVAKAERAGIQVLKCVDEEHWDITAPTKVES